MPNEQTPVVANSPAPVVGVDPTPEVVETPAAPVVAAAPVSSGPEPVMLTQQEYDALQQKSSNYDMISNDPVLASQVLDHYRAKTGRVNQRAVEKPAEEEEREYNDPRVDEQSRRIAQLEIEAFRAAHPDMKDIEQDMSKLISRHGMSLQDAYKFSRAVKAPAQQNTAVRTSPAVPTTETNQDAGHIDNSNTDLSELERQLNDPKATPHMDDVIEKAWKAARKHHAAE